MTHDQICALNCAICGDGEVYMVDDKTQDDDQPGEQPGGLCHSCYEMLELAYPGEAQDDVCSYFGLDFSAMEHRDMVEV